MTEYKTKQEIGTRLANIRMSRNLSQADASKFIEEATGEKISAETIGKWETANRRIKAEDIRILAKAFGVSADYILCINDQPSPDMDIQGAAEMTGLSHKSLKVLKYLKETPSDASPDAVYMNLKTIACINRILEDAADDFESYHNLHWAGKTDNPEQYAWKETLFALIEMAISAKDYGNNEAVQLIGNAQSGVFTLQQIIETMSMEKVENEIRQYRIKERLGF